jgi:hypothetical protein
MPTYKISNAIHGAPLGVYQAVSRADALEQLARDAGYPDYATACEDSPVVHGEVVISIVHRPSFMHRSVR